MAAKKVTSRTRSTTKRSKTTRSTTKRATKAKSAAKPAPAPAPVEYTPPVRVAKVAKPIPDGGPSRFTGDYYLHATGPQSAEGSNRRPGKWLIFVSRSRIDALWDDVRRAVTSGRLGHAAKVSTALPNPLSRDPKKHVICVYTADEADAADVRRVRDGLRALGVTWKIPYKSDAATGAGQYDDPAGGPAAKYYE